MFDLVYRCMQLRLPIVLSPTLTFSLSIYEMFLGSCFLYITYLVIKFFLTGVISYEKFSTRTEFVNKYKNAKNEVTNKEKKE